MAEYGITYPVLLGNARIARLFNDLETIPQTFFLDREGRVVDSYEGLRGEPALDKAVQTLLSEQ